MKVGDLVVQGNRVLMIKGSKRKSKMIGVVVAIRDMPPARPEETEVLRQMMAMLGRQVDVLWPNGHVSKNFAENGLEVVTSKEEWLEAVSDVQEG